jgi:hypothetical protein
MKKRDAGRYHKTRSYYTIQDKHTNKLAYTDQNYYRKFRQDTDPLFNIDTIAQDFDIIRKAKLNSIQFFCSMMTLGDETKKVN